MTNATIIVTAIGMPIVIIVISSSSSSSSSSGGGGGGSSSEGGGEDKIKAQTCAGLEKMPV
jgi:preprotein translocase subunit SecG